MAALLRSRHVELRMPVDVSFQFWRLPERSRPKINMSRAMYLRTDKSVPRKGSRMAEGGLSVANGAAMDYAVQK